MAAGTHARREDRQLDRATILLVDDDERWARVTGRLVESNTDAFSVETAHSLAAGRERFASLEPDCVVCDYQLGDGTGLDLLDGVRESDPDLPFILVTGRGSEEVASDAIRQGVTDYIRKANEDADLLASRIENAVRTYRTEQALERERRSKNAMLDVLTATTDRAGLYQQFPARLVDQRGYACAWIGDEETAGHLVPRAAAGREAYLDDVVDAGEGLLPDEPARAALARDDTVVELVESGVGQHSSNGTRSGETGETGNWRAVARAHGFEAAVAAPIRHDGVRFGVLAVYADDEALVDEREVDAIAEYAETIGYALRTAEWKRSLVSSDPVTISVELDDRAVPAVALADAIGGTTRIEIPSAVTRDDGSTLYVARVDGVAADDLRRAADGLDTIESLSVTGDSPVACQFVAVPPTPESVVAGAGGNFERTVVEDGVATLTVKVADDGVVDTVADTLDAQFGDATVSTIWTDDGRRDSTDSGDPLDALTDRQREVLCHAFHVGYFERPRGASATELADHLDIARATLTQHLRTAQRKVFDSLLD